MNITINQITPRRENGAVIAFEVHFTARTEDGSINLNGSIPIADVSLIDFDAIGSAVKTEIVNKIMNGDLPGA